MKYTLATLLLFIILILPSCKKETTHTGNIGNTDTRTGLELLTDTGATGYCVLIVTTNTTRDTLIWQSTNGGTMQISSGAFGVGGSYHLAVDNLYKPAVAVHFKSLQMQFRKVIPGLPPSYSCNTIDTIIPTGIVPVNDDHAVIVLGDMTTTNSTQFISNASAVVEVLSATKILQTTGCYKLRVKAKLTNIQFGPFGCITPAYNINDGLVLMDFQLP